MEIAPTYAPIRLRAEVADLDPAGQRRRHQGLAPSSTWDPPCPDPDRAITSRRRRWRPGLVAGIGRRSWRHGVASACIPFLALQRLCLIGLFTRTSTSWPTPARPACSVSFPTAPNAAQFFDDRDRFAQRRRQHQRRQPTCRVCSGWTPITDVVRILHIGSDLHLNSAALAFAGRLTTFDVDVVANTGDDADWGSDVGPGSSAARSASTCRTCGCFAATRHSRHADRQRR